MTTQEQNFIEEIKKETQSLWNKIAEAEKNGYSVNIWFPNKLQGTSPQLNISKVLFDSL